MMTHIYFLIFFSLTPQKWEDLGKLQVYLLGGDPGKLYGWLTGGEGQESESWDAGTVRWMALGKALPSSYLSCPTDREGSGQESLSEAFQLGPVSPYASLPHIPV